MRNYVIRRVLYAFLTMFLVVTATFFMLRVIPGDVVDAMLGSAEEQAVSADDIQRVMERMREELGLNEPLYSQYLNWVWSIVTLDPGTSLITRKPMLEHFGNAIWVTLELGVLTFIVSLIMAVIIGTIAALKQDTWLDYSLRGSTILGLALPTFWLGVMVTLFLALWVQYVIPGRDYGWMPPPGFRPLFEDPIGNLTQFAIPALIVGWRSSAITARMVRSTILEVLREDYVRTAWAKGLVQRVILTRHVFKNAALPVVTLLGLQVAGIISGSVVTEIVFGLPGMGQITIQAVYARDYTVFQFLVLLFGFVVVGMNLIVDLMYGWLDPRIKFS